ncbi:hypothetical protein XH92_11990 [Bradyrhizobium sp. CCBAU 53421]|nr:hypothetical protein XH92_11990 [Bradyrhizobium sp. CCBAU 53421]
MLRAPFRSSRKIEEANEGLTKERAQGPLLIVARAFSSEVATGSREENASKQESRTSVLM